MTYYSNHKYRALFAFIEEGCKRTGEERDFVTYLLSMENAASIEELIKILNNIYKLFATFIYGKEKWPKRWYFCEYWGMDNAKYVDVLYQYFNENLLQIFKKIEKPTEVDYIKFIVNFRVCDNILDIEEEMLRDTSEEVMQYLKTYISSRNYHYYRRKTVEKYIDDPSTVSAELNGYKIATKSMLGNGRILDIAEVKFGNMFNIDYEELIKSYKEELERRKIFEEKRIEKEKREKKNKRISFNDNNIVDDAMGLIGAGLLSLPFGLLGGIFSAAKSSRRRRY